MPQNAKHSHDRGGQVCVIVEDGVNPPAGIIAVAVASADCDAWFERNDAAYSRHSHYSRPVVKA